MGLDLVATHWRKDAVRALHTDAVRALRGLGRQFVDFVYPPTCLACRGAVAAPGALCPSCWAQIRFIERPFCARLGTPFALDLGGDHLIAPEAFADPPAYGRARAVAVFDGPARRLVHRLKYADRLDLAPALGAWMARAGDELLSEADILVPIPLHRRRLIARRFNQSVLLARAVSARCGVPVVVDGLERVKATASQVGLSRTQRSLNLQGAFKVHPGEMGLFLGRSIVLIDDVLTSGATLNAASRALLRAGAAQVDALVFARVVTGL
jgi:ComF family protein